MSRPKIGIYKITSTVNDKVYVGQSHDIKGRWRDHRHKSSNAHMRNAMIKDGLDNFVFEILEEGEMDQVDLDIREIFWIEKLESRNPSKGYNKLSGGSNGRHSEESKALMSARKRILNQGCGNPFYGRSHSEETKNLLREKGGFNMPHVRQAAIDSLKGKPWPEARRRAHEEKKLQSQKVKS